MAEISEKDLIAALDNMMTSGVSRLKIDVNDNVAEGDVEKKYHHGRCDVGSPFATGQLFNFEDGCE
ncbi:MAG: hypothetical protein Q4D29_02715 [Lachnospiraceae bacterium]|nr:hypothetical protein [Lachnospiraceae bacterium]